MNGRRLTILIDGRDALPVRAIPYVTGWQFPPNVVAKYLADEERYTNWYIPLVAHQLFDDANLQVQPREWDAVVATLEGYEAELKLQHPNDSIGYAAWRKSAASKLPKGVFVWLDEIEPVYKAKQKRVLEYDSKYRKNGIRITHFERKRDGDDKLILTPMLDDETRAMVLEGFELGPRDSAATQKVGAGATAPAEPKQAAIITTHRLKTRSNPLDAVIDLATKTAVAPDDSQSVYAKMVTLAEAENKPAPLVGYSSEGIQYRGKKYEETGEPDTFTAKNLRDRMARAKAR